MSVAQASGFVALAILLSRILGLVRDAVISRNFGLEAERDAYVAAFAIPDLLFFLIAGGALSSAFIPIFTRYLTNGEEDEAWKVFSTLATFMGIVVIAFIVVASLFARPLMSVLRPGLPPDVMTEAARLSIILLPTQLAFFLGGLMFGAMQARKHFVIPGLAPNIYNLGIILGAAVVAHVAGLGIYGVAWGALAGAITGSLLIPIFAMPRFGARYKPMLNLKHPGVRSVFALMLPVILGLSLPGVYAIVVIGFGSLYGQGAVSALDIANRIMQAPLGIFGQSLAIAIFPTLAELFAKRDAAKFLLAISKTARTAVYIGLFVSAIFFVLSEDIVRLLNQYGKFGGEDTVYVAAGLRMFSVGIFAWCAHPVLMRAYFAMHDTLTPILLGTIATGIFVALAFFLPSLRLDFGFMASDRLPGSDFTYAGLGLAVSLAAIALFGMLVIGLKRKLGRVDGRRLLAVLIRGGIAALLAAGAVAIAANLIPMPEARGLAQNLVSLVRVLGLGLAGAWLYLGMGKALGLEEATYALNAIRRRSTAQEPPGPSQ